MANAKKKTIVVETAATPAVDPKTVRPDAPEAAMIASRKALATAARAESKAGAALALAVLDFRQYQPTTAKSFGAWAAKELAAEGITAAILSPRRLEQLAQTGEFLSRHDAPAITALPSRAILAMAQKEEELTAQGIQMAEVPAILNQRGGDSVATITALADYGREGDQRNEAEKRADEVAAFTETLVSVLARAIALGVSPFGKPWEEAQAIAEEREEKEKARHKAKMEAATAARNAKK